MFACCVKIPGLKMSELIGLRPVQQRFAVFGNPMDAAKLAVVE
jgi:hypothetical protein